MKHLGQTFEGGRVVLGKLEPQTLAGGDDNFTFFWPLYAFFLWVLVVSVAPIVRAPSSHAEEQGMLEAT